MELEEYNIDSLPRKLIPRKLPGSYKCISRLNGSSCFLFAFSSTLPANGAKRRDFTWLPRKALSVDLILPDVPNPPQRHLIIDDEVVLVAILPGYIEEVVKDVIKKGDMQDIPEACAELIAKNPPQSVKADKPTINKTVIRQLRESIFNDFDVVDNETEEGEDNYSQYELSKEDFGIHPMEFNEEIRVGCVTPSMDDDDDDDDTGDGSDTGDWQLLANMYKTAAEAAYRSATSGTYLFNKIIVYGVLVCYSAKSTKRVAVLELDLINRNPSLKWCKADLNIENAFERLKQQLQLAVVPRS
jgi:hypothetical protein